MSKDPIEFTKKLLKSCSEEYKERVISLYPEAYSENPEAFPFANYENLDAYIITVNEKLLSFPSYIVVYQGNGEVINLGEIPDEEYSKLKNYPSENDFVLDIINNIIQQDRKKYYYFASHLYQFLTSDNYKTPEDFINIQRKNIGKIMLSKLKQDGEAFREHINKEASYYAKDAFRYVYSELDFSPIITVVNDKDFEYALNESLACYDNSLYLAAVSTAGTALENLMVKMLETKGEFTDDSSPTELGVLSSRLRNAGVIDKREKKRIMLAASFRNLASHANKGRVTRQEAKLIYQEIFNLAANYFGI